MHIHGYDIHAYLWISWISMVIHGYPWVSMDIHGYPWIPIDTHGYPWICMGIHGYRCISMDIHIHAYPWMHFERLSFERLSFQMKANIRAISKDSLWKDSPAQVGSNACNACNAGGCSLARRAAYNNLTIDAPNYIYREFNIWPYMPIYGYICLYIVF